IGVQDAVWPKHSANLRQIGAWIGQMLDDLFGAHDIEPSIGEALSGQGAQVKVAHATALGSLLGPGAQFYAMGLPASPRGAFDKVSRTAAEIEDAAFAGQHQLNLFEDAVELRQLRWRGDASIESDESLRVATVFVGLGQALVGHLGI